MTNAHGGGRLAAQVMSASAMAYDWPDWKPLVRTEVKVNPAVLARYVGTYQLAPSFSVTFCGLQLGLLLLTWFSTMTGRRVKAEGAPSVLRASGLIIVDQQGRPRILLGSPFPKVKGRTRQDSTTTSMVFLDEQGHDRLTLGEEPEPQVGGKVVATLRVSVLSFIMATETDEEPTGGLPTGGH